MRKTNKILSVWLIGLSGSGKTTIGTALKSRLSLYYGRLKLLDGDVLRNGLNKDLGFTDEDRAENIRRVAEINRLFIDCGITVINCFICPTQEIVNSIIRIVGKEHVLICHIDTPLSVCEERDPKGLYKKARKGVLKNFTGVDSIYEIPQADIVLRTLDYDVDKCVEIIVEKMKD